MQSIKSDNSHTFCVQEVIQEDGSAIGVCKTRGRGRQQKGEQAGFAIGVCKTRGGADNVTKWV